MNTYLRLFVFLCLVALCFAFSERGKCGTTRPTRPTGSGTSDRSIPVCGVHECDDPAVRNLYTVGPNTPVTIMNLNVIYFGNLSGTAKTTYDAQMEFFNQKFLKFLKIGWNINTTVVTDRYQSVDPDDDTTQQQIAMEFYVPGYMTMIWIAFSPNPDYLLGFAYLPQDLDLVSAPETFFSMLEINDAMAPEGTTLPHEVGHMFGLLHTFIEDDNPRCNTCVENMDDTNRDILGDFCNDTLAVPMTFKCSSLDGNTDDCHGNTFKNLTGLPQHNYMAYTPDSCQYEFTPHQAARARCYMDKLLGAYVASVQETPAGSTPSSSTPTNNNTPKSGNTPIKAPVVKTVSVGSRVTDQMFIASTIIIVGFGLLAL